MVLDKDILQKLHTRKALPKDKQGKKYAYGFYDGENPTICPVCKKYIPSVMPSGKYMRGGAEIVIKNYNVQHLCECLADKKFWVGITGVIKVEVNE